MRFKFSLSVQEEVSGNVLPITYQQNLTDMFRSMFTADQARLQHWLDANGLDPNGNEFYYVISNLYIPKIVVDNDRLKICVPRVQFWVSFLPEVDTRKMLEESFLEREIVLGDSLSSVHFVISEIDDISPVTYHPVMDYQALSPIVVKAYRSNNTLEYLSPNNPYFAQFLVDSIVERWEQYYGCQFYDSRAFRFSLLSPERRKAVPVVQNGVEKKAIGYMLKFRLEMSPMLHEFAYVTGMGDDLHNGFGYVELMRKHK